MVSNRLCVRGICGQIPKHGNQWQRFREFDVRESACRVHRCSRMMLLWLAHGRPESFRTGALRRLPALRVELSACCDSDAVDKTAKSKRSEVEATAFRDAPACSRSSDGVCSTEATAERITAL